MPSPASVRGDLRAMQDFSRELQRLGPNAPVRSWSLDQARGYCSRLARTHYENFSVVSFLVPRQLVRHFEAIYAYCRWADDLADETEGGQTACDLLNWWRQELQHCFQGRSVHPVMIALQPTVQRFQIPPEPFLDLLLAFEQDQRKKRYETFQELLEYCRYSANPVGRLVLYLGECYSEERAQYSDAICTALQLTNFWQDVRRDLDDLDRVYLPREDRERFGYSEHDLLARRFTPAFARLLEFEVQRAFELFQQGKPLLSMLPEGLRPSVELFLRGGLGILDRIRMQGYDVWASRPRIGRLAKSFLLGRALLARWGRMSGLR